MATDGTVKIGTKLDKSGFKKGLDELGSFAKSGFNVLTDVAKVAAASVAAVGTALAGVAIASANAGIEFEAQMSRVKAISGATREEFALLTEQAKELGASTSFSASEAAMGMENLASAGFSVIEIMDAMPGMLDLAASSGESLALSADIAASTLRGFGLEASQAGHVADVLAKNAADTNAAVADTGEAMKYIAPVAHAMGLSLEEVAATIGILADAGIKGSQGGTTLRSALSRLAKPTKAMREVMDDLSISFYNSNGEMKSIAELIDTLRVSMADLTNEEKQSAMVTLFGQEALSGLMVLMEAGPEKLSAMTEAYKDCDGAAAEMAETMLDNLKGAIEEFGGAAETFQLEVYDLMETPLKNLAQRGTEYINQLTEGLKTGGVSGLVEAGKGIIGELITGVYEQLPTIIETGFRVVNEFKASIVENLPTLFDKGTDLLVKLIDGIASMLPGMVQTGIESVVKLAEAILNSDNIMKMVNAGIQLIYSLVQGVINALPVLIDKVPELITAFWDTFDSLLWKVVEAGFNLVKMLGKGIIDNIGNIIANADEIVVAIVSTIAHLDMIKVGTNLIKNLATGIKTMLKSIWQAADDVVYNLSHPFNIKDWSSIGKNLINGIKEGILSAARGLADAAKNAVGGAISSAKEFLGINSPSKLARDLLGKNTIAGIGVGFEMEADNLGETAEETVEGAVNRMQKKLDVTAAVNAMKGNAYRTSDAILGGNSATNKIPNDAEKPEPQGDNDLPERIGRAVGDALENKAFKVGEREFARLVEEVT